MSCKTCKTHSFNHSWHAEESWFPAKKFACLLTAWGWRIFILVEFNFTPNNGSQFARNILLRPLQGWTHCALFGPCNFAQRASGSLLLTNGPSYIHDTGRTKKMSHFLSEEWWQHFHKVGHFFGPPFRMERREIAKRLLEFRTLCYKIRQYVVSKL